MLAASPIRPAVSEPIALPAKALAAVRSRDLGDEDLVSHNMKVNLTAQNEGGTFEGENYEIEDVEDEDQFEDMSYQGRVHTCYS